MTDFHPSPQALEGFVRGDLSQEEACLVISHLLNECPHCKVITGASWESMVQGLSANRREINAVQNLSGEVYGETLDRALERAKIIAGEFAQESSRGERLFAELLEHPQPRRLTLIRNSRRFQSTGLCERLIEKSYEQRFDDPRVGVELAESAAAVAENLPVAQREEPRALDLLGRCWAYLGNSHRVASNLGDAEQAFQKAAEFFKEGTHEELDQALLYRFRALLLRAQRRFEESYRFQDRAVRIYRRCGETRLAALVLSDMGLGLIYSGESERALPVLQQAAELHRDLEDERGAIHVHHNLALCLSQMGRHQEALEVLRGVETKCRQLGERLSAARVCWLEGRIYQGLGLSRLSEALLLEARDIFIQSDIAYDAALVCMDLAEVYANQNRVTEVRQLAEQMVPIFQSRKVHREALAALLIFREAALAENLTLTLLERVSTFLREARNNPQLRLSQS